MASVEREALPVIFRAERSGDFKGDVTAVFPTLPGTNEPHSVTIYAHIGQHGSGNFGWYSKTRKAKPEEYADLLRELRGIYEREGDPEAVRLVICQRWTQRHDAARREELARSRQPAAEPEMTWAAGWNLPGFMPDAEPEHVETAQEARDYIAAEMRRYADDDTGAEYADSETEGERVAGMLREAADDCDALEGDSEFGRTVGGYHYWATRL